MRIKFNFKQARTRFLACAIAMVISIFSFGQKPIRMPAAGGPAPDFSLSVRSPHGKPLGKLSIQAFKGKWLVLDFWSRSCIACIAAMPKLSSLQQQFGDKIAFLLIGKNDERYNAGIETFYKRLAKNEKLALYTAFDTLSFQTYQVRSTPHVVIIDPEGKCYAVTSSSELTSDRLSALIECKKPNFAPLVPPLAKAVTQASNPIEEDEGKSYIGLRTDTVSLTKEKISYTASLSPWTKGQRLNLKLDLKPSLTSGTFTTGAISLERLYLLAYLGKAEWNINDSLYLNTTKKTVKQMADTSLFEKDFATASGLYNYNLGFSKRATLEQFQLAMQQDLKARFGYRVQWEKQPITVYQLKVIDPLLAAKLKSTTEQRLVKGDATGYRFQKAEIKDLLYRIQYYHPKLLLEDHTDIRFPIDLDLRVSMLNLAALKKALEYHGLKLVPLTKLISVLVIADP